MFFVNAFEPPAPPKKPAPKQPDPQADFQLSFSNVINSAKPSVLAPSTPQVRGTVVFPSRPSESPAPTPHSASFQGKLPSIDDKKTRLPPLPLTSETGSGGQVPAKLGFLTPSPAPSFLSNVYARPPEPTDNAPTQRGGRRDPDVKVISRERSTERRPQFVSLEDSYRSPVPPREGPRFLPHG